MTRTALGIILTLTLVTSAGDVASASVWERIRDPETARARALGLEAERSRVPRDPERFDADDLELLSKRSALLLELGHAELYEDEHLLFLFADTLFEAGDGFQARARKAILHALQTFPTSPHAGAAWANLGALEREADRAPAARDAYTLSLTLTWSASDRALLHLLRAEEHMLLGDVAEALSDYDAVLGLGAPGELVVRAEWGAAVAYERSFDLSRALGLASRASRARFGAPTPVSVIDLPGSVFRPAYEEHYFRALAETAEAEEETDPKRAAERFQTAAFLWSLYIADARRAVGEGEEPRWVANAIRHQRSATERAERLSAGRR